MVNNQTVHIGSYQYVKAYIPTPNGGRKQIYAKTKTELNKKILAYYELQHDTPQGPTVAQYAKKQLKLMKNTVSSATYEGYRVKVQKYIIDPLGKMKVSEVTRDDILQAMGPLHDQSSSSYRTVHMLMCKIFEAAKINHIITEDPTEYISGKGGQPKKDIPSLSDQQVQTLLAAVHGLKVETFVLLGLCAGLRREEILALQWDCVHLDQDTPYISVSRAWRIEHNRPTISSKLKSKAAHRDIPIPPMLIDHLRTVKASSNSDYVISNDDGEPLTGTEWKNMWNTVKVRSTEPRTYYRTVNGKKISHTITPVLGEHARNNPNVVYSIDFHVNPHQLRHTYITDMIYSGADPKSVQYLAGHENSQVTMDIYANVKYNRPHHLAPAVNHAFSFLCPA